MNVCTKLDGKPFKSCWDISPLAWLKIHKATSTHTDSQTDKTQGGFFSVWAQNRKWHLNLLQIYIITNSVLILGFKHGSDSSVKSPSRRQAVESISSSATAPANHGNPSGWLKISPSKLHIHGLSHLVDFLWAVIFTENKSGEVICDNAFLKSCHERNI